MASNVCISFTVESSNPQVPLGFEAWLDDQKFFDTEHVNQAQTVQTELSDDSASHQLRLVLKNKTHEHTQINEAGDIVSDATLAISNMTFDQIELGHVFVEKSRYIHDFNGTATTDTHRFYGEMGCNGSVTLEFTTPMYLWLLENL